MSSIAEFVRELQRRSVIRAAIVHVLFFWLLVQVADVVLPYIGIVEEPVRWAVFAGVGLFPLTLVVAWFYEHPWTHLTRGRLATDIILIALIGIGTSLWVLRNLPDIVHTRTSIVVMPFTHSGTDSEASLSRALVSEVNSLLMKSRSIDVIGFESATSAALEGLDAIAIANRLNVEHVLGGTIAARGERLAIDLQLKDQNGDALWDSRIEDDLENLFSIQEDIAISVESLLGAGEDAVPVADVAANRCWRPIDTGAIEIFYTARYYTELRTYTDDAQEKLRAAIRFYEELIDDYPDFAEAYSGLAWALRYQSIYDPENAVEDLRAQIRELGERALRACPTLTEALHLVPGQHSHPNWLIQQYRLLAKFVENEPQRYENYQQLARLYRNTGLFDRALGVARRTYELNPLSVRSIKEYAFVLQDIGELERSSELFDLSVELGSTTPNFSAIMLEMDKCGDNLECFLDLLPEPFVQHKDALREIYVLAESEDTAQQAIDAAMALLEQDPDLTNWMNSFACGEPHMAPLFFKVWEFANTTGTYWHWIIVWADDCKHVWAHPDFPALVEEQGFVEYWREIDAWPPACRRAGDSFTCGPVER